MTKKQKSDEYPPLIPAGFKLYTNYELIHICDAKKYLKRAMNFPKSLGDVPEKLFINIYFKAAQMAMLKAVHVLPFDAREIVSLSGQDYADYLQAHVDPQKWEETLKLVDLTPEQWDEIVNDFPHLKSPVRKGKSAVPSVKLER